MFIGIREIWCSCGSAKIKFCKYVDFFLGTLIACIVPGRAARKAFVPDWRSMLIIRPGGIGDAVFLLSILRKLKNRGLTVDVLCERRNAPVFESQPEVVSKVYRYDDLRSLKRFLNNQYDVVVDTEQWHYLSAILGYLLKAKYHIGFASRPLRAKLFDRSVVYGLDEYELSNFAKLFALWIKEGECADINASYEIAEDLQQWAQGFIPENSITLFLGASIPARRFTFEQSKELIRCVLDRGFTPVLLGGQDVQKEGEYLEQALQDKRIKNCAGKTTFAQSAALIQRSRLFIGTDSGMLHLACAVRAPVVGVFGPGNKAKWGPRGAQHRTSSLDVECSPCTQFGYTLPTCHGSYRCMRQIKIKEVWRVAEKFLFI